MAEQIAWFVELAVEPERLHDYHELTREMIDAARGEPGTLIYERHLSEDGGTVFIYERYADSAAAVSHLQDFDARFADRFHGMIRRQRFLVFGTPSRELKSRLDAFGAVYLATIGGFAR